MSPKRQPDFPRLIEHLKTASKAVEDAIGELSPVTAIRATDAAVFGHLRNIEAGLQSVVDFVQQTHAFKEGKVVPTKEAVTVPLKTEPPSTK